MSYPSARTAFAPSVTVSNSMEVPLERMISKLCASLFGSFTVSAVCLTTSDGISTVVIGLLYC